LVRDAQPSQRAWDLGERWRELTGLPFVFAVWGVRTSGDWAVGKVLREAKANGLAHLEQIVQDATEASPEFLREYYTHNVWYELGERKSKGWRVFSSSRRTLV